MKVKELTTERFEKIASNSLLMRCLVHEERPQQPSSIVIWLFSCCEEPSFNGRKVFYEINYRDVFPRQNHTTSLGLEKRLVLPDNEVDRDIKIFDIIEGWKKHLPPFAISEPVVAGKIKVASRRVIKISPTCLLLMEAYRDLLTRLAYGIQRGHWLSGTFTRFQSLLKQYNKRWQRTLGAIY